MRPWSPPRAACPRPSLPAGLEGPGLPRLRWPGQQVPVPPGPPERRGHPSLASCWALAKHRNESHHRPLIRLPTAGRGPRVPAQCLPSTLREARAPGPCAGVSAPCLPPDLGPPGSADPAPRICRPRAARVDAPGGRGRPCGRPACVAEQCSALSRVITASALGRRLGTGLRDVCE